MPKKLTLKFVKSETSRLAKGFKCKSEEYKNNYTKILFECSKGHEFWMTWSNFKAGWRCSVCYGNKTHNIEYIKKEFEKKNWKLVSTLYKNSKQKLYYICNNNHTGKITWNDFKTGYGCSKCSNNYKPNIKEIKKEFEKEGYKLLSKKYKNNHSRLKVLCDNNHMVFITLSAFKQGQRCSECWKISIVGEGHHRWRGGISCEPYCDAWADKEYKEDIKERDGYRCLNPDCWKTSKRLCIMHIDNNKKNCSPSNLITGCNSCNARAQKDREWWTFWYQAIMYRRYGYNY